MVATIAIIVDGDRPVAPFAADEAAESSRAETAGSLEEASGVSEALECPLLGPCSGETWGRSRC